MDRGREREEGGFSSRLGQKKRGTDEVSAWEVYCICLRAGQQESESENSKTARPNSSESRQAQRKRKNKIK